MAKKIIYSKTYFRAPSKITEEYYRILKNEIYKNPNYRIASELTESFSQHFKTLLNTIYISGGYFIFFIMIYGNKTESETPGILTALSGIAVFTILISLMYLLFEGPSYASFLKDKEAYYNRMKVIINNSSTYLEFENNFYKK